MGDSIQSDDSETYPHWEPLVVRLRFLLLPSLSPFAFATPFSHLPLTTHNSQPWQFALNRDSVDVFADRSRSLPVVDPDDRELTISCGACVHHLRLDF
jgi:hypothetical protein